MIDILFEMPLYFKKRIKIARHVLIEKNHISILLPSDPVPDPHDLRIVSSLFHETAKKRQDSGVRGCDFHGRAQLWTDF